MPAWIDFAGGVYGSPDLEGRGFKVGLDHHGPPIDPDTGDGSAIEIEQRPGAEVAEYRGSAITPAGAAVHNPAFDVTPADLVDAIITEAGVLRAPYGPAIEAALGGRGTKAGG